MQKQDLTAARAFYSEALEITQIADLERAIEFRRRLREVRVERTASMEPIGFALLRLGKFEEAVAHTAQVDRSRPMPGNLIVRALAAWP